MSDTGTFGFIGNGVQFPGKNNVVRDGSGSNAFGWENSVIGRNSLSSGNRNRITADLAYAFGYLNVVSSTWSIAVGSTNTVTTQISGAFGQANSVTGYASYAFGFNHAVSGSYSFAYGSSNTASGTSSCAVGYFNTASASRSFACGSYGLASRYGEFAIGGWGVSIVGACQQGFLTFGNQSTSATPVNLYLDGTIASSNAVLAAGARWNCTLKIQAATTGAIGKDGSWEYAFTICRPTTAATTIIRTTPVLVRSDGSNAGAPPAGWSISITSDTTNGCPQIQVTGDADTINWTAALHYVQAIRV